MDMLVPQEIIDADTGDVFDGSFGALTINTPLDVLFGEYAQYVKQIRNMVEAVKDSPAIPFFLDGHRKSSRDRSMPSPETLFCESNALAALNSFFWSRAIALTGVMKVMPAAKRNEWSNQISEMETPAFEEDTVRATLMDLLNSKNRFFAEKVDGMFRALSSEHVTNVPEGFSKRMIVGYMLDGYGYTNHRQVEYVHDLREVIAKFLGREEFPHWATNDAIKGMSLDGKWNTLDGGALRIRLYKRGTAHLEVHPDIAWRLNAVLAFLYPTAIPAQFRKRPLKRCKEFNLREDVISQRVCTELNKLVEFLRRGDKKTIDLTGTKLLWPKEIEHIFTVVGGVEVSPKRWVFDYQPHEVLREVVRSALIPDQQSHQFYPTPAHMAQEVVDLAEIGDTDSVLEPSSGTCSIASLLPVDRTQCVEISKLHCQVAQTLGYAVENADFLSWEPGRLFAKVCMNPPFSLGRAKAHVVKAAGLLAPGGKLVAILPGGMKDTIVVPGMKHSYSALRHNEFKDACVSVTILVLQ